MTSCSWQAARGVLAAQRQGSVNLACVVRLQVCRARPLQTVGRPVLLIIAIAVIVPWWPDARRLCQLHHPHSYQAGLDIAESKSIGFTHRSTWLFQRELREVAAVKACRSQLLML